MAGDVVIRAEGLGKKYAIGHQSADQSATFRDAMVRAGGNFLRTTRDILRGKPIVAGDEIEEFWALKDVDFEIRRGDVVGIIGRNGAGKSTLLKILSRITEPSEGRVEIKGRVASLLEVGTGFHPELSGRENVYLNGAILGMSRAEIRRKFDEIVAFAEIEKFLDTPVKRYSSGMYVRLAFAVAAHLEPEILVVDEVLAVGDAEFQKKCLGKMQDVAGEGRTVLFVSHNMGVVQQLCSRGMYLKQGCIVGFEGISASIDKYLAQDRTAIHSDTFTNDECELAIKHLGNGLIRIAGRSTSATRGNFALGVVLQNLSGADILETGSTDHPGNGAFEQPRFERTLQLPFDQLRPGAYIVRAFAYLHNESWLVGKDKGPQVQVEVANPDNAGPLYFQRPAGFGPVIAWHDVP